MKRKIKVSRQLYRDLIYNHEFIPRNSMHKTKKGLNVDLLVIMAVSVLLMGLLQGW